MKTIFGIGLLVLVSGCSGNQENAELKSLLLQQLKNTHADKNWFVPINPSVEGLTVLQANWKDSTGNHSIGELVSHLIFWNERNLISFQGNTPPDFSGDNKATFKTLNEKEWALSVKKIDSVQTLLERTVEKATEQEVREWSSTIVNICAHNAYHTGQIIYIRKQNGWWDDEKGVK